MIINHVINLSFISRLSRLMTGVLGHTTHASLKNDFYRFSIENFVFFVEF